MSEGSGRVNLRKRCRPFYSVYLGVFHFSFVSVARAKTQDDLILIADANQMLVRDVLHVD